MKEKQFLERWIDKNPNTVGKPQYSKEEVLKILESYAQSKSDVSEEERIEKVFKDNGHDIEILGTINKDGSVSTKQHPQSVEPLSDKEISDESHKAIGGVWQKDYYTARKWFCKGAKWARDKRGSELNNKE